MGTLADLKARVAADLGRDDLTVQIASAIARAIEHHAGTRFWFNADRRTTITTAGGADVDAPDGLRVPDRDGTWVSVGATRYRLRRRSAELIEDWLAAGGGTGQPSDYAFIGGGLRVYPTPNAAYVVTVLGIYDLAALVLDTDANPWTDTAQDLIAARARYTINRDVLRDFEAASADQAAEAEALNALRRETARREATGRVAPSC